MKNIIKIIIFLILAASVANAQNMDTIFQKFIEQKLIEQKQIKDFESLIKGQEKSNSVYLAGLFQIEFKKLTGQLYSPIGTYLSFGDTKPVEAEQNKINGELSSYLTKLKNCDLISEKHFIKQQNKIISNEYVHIFQLLTDISNQSALEEHMNSNKLKTFAEKLKTHLISTTKYDSLIKNIDNNNLENPIEFLNYCEKAVIINENDYSDKPEDYLEELHKKTASILPELGFTDFSFQIVLDSSISSTDSKFYKFVVTIQSNGKKYKQQSSYHLYSPSKNQYFGNKIDQQTYYKLFNKILADLQSPYRLHEVKGYNGNAVNWQIFGIIALTKEQAKMLHNGGVYFTPSYENFKNTLTTKRIEQAIEEYQKIGLLNHLTQEQVIKAKDRIAERSNTNLNDILLSFPNIVVTFDTELANLEDPYAELVGDYSKISHNEFNPTNVSDDFDIEKKKKVTLQFKFKTKSYKRVFKIENDWIDTDFFEFMKNVVKEHNLKGQFYELYEGGQGASIIYLTTEQYTHLRTNKLAIFGDEWQTETED